jgi:hypothetical protein
MTMCQDKRIRKYVNMVETHLMSLPDDFLDNLQVEIESDQILKDQQLYYVSIKMVCRRKWDDENQDI